MQLEIVNFGIIDYAKIEIKPLTIIAGKNSTGKTFITKSLFILLETLRINLLEERIFYIKRELNSFYKKLKESLSTDNEIPYNLLKEIYNESIKLYKFLDELHIYIKENINFKGDDLEKFRNKIFPILTNLENYLEKIDKEKNKGFLDILKNLFIGKHFIFELKYILEDIEQILNKNTYSFLIKGKLNSLFKSNFSVQTSNSLVNRCKKNAYINLNSFKIKINKSKGIFILDKGNIYPFLNIKNVYYLDSPIYLKLKDGFYEDSYLPYYLNKFLKSLRKKNKIEENEEKMQILKKISSLIRGYIDLDDFGNIIFREKVDKFDYSDIPISLAAMGQTNIAIIDWLIRNDYIVKNSFLLIDEPEVHLHPEWQKKLMYIFYELAKYGINIIIATHSIDMIYSLEAIFSKDKNAEEIIAINKLPYDENFTKKSFTEKIDEIIEDLGESFIDTYFEVK